MSPELEDIRRGAQKVTQAVSPAAWMHAPDGKWNCAQIFEHLLLSYEVTSSALSKRMQIGSPVEGKRSLGQRLGTFWVLTLGFLPSGREAPPQARPNAGVPLESMRRYYDALVALDATLNDAERRFGGSAKLAVHPILGPFNAQEWRKFHRVHAEHHFRRVADRIRQASAGRQSGTPA